MSLLYAIQCFRSLASVLLSLVHAHLDECGPGRLHALTRPLQRQSVMFLASAQSGRGTRGENGLSACDLQGRKHGNILVASRRSGWRQDYSMLGR